MEKLGYTSGNMLLAFFIGMTIEYFRIPNVLTDFQLTVAIVDMLGWGAIFAIFLPPFIEISNFAITILWNLFNPLPKDWDKKAEDIKKFG